MEALAAGNTRRTACQLAGVSEDAFARWLARYAGFAEAVQRAEAEAEAHHVANVKRAADDGTWTASAWWLERRRSDDWGRRDKVEIVNSIREMVRRDGATPEEEAEAVAEAERVLTELRRNAR